MSKGKAPENLKNTVMEKYNLTSGSLYNPIFGNGAPTFSINGNTAALKFNKSFPCYDARFHGVANPSDYICYEFQLPGTFGVWRAYQFQILSISPVS